MVTGLRSCFVRGEDESIAGYVRVTGWLTRASGIGRAALMPGLLSVVLTHEDLHSAMNREARL
jgi:hypothetical protein